MAEVKATPMVLKANLECHRCYRKIKKLLCSYDEIHDQMFNEKQGTVMITVYCCSPERIRQKLLYKGGKSILSIDIVPPQNKPKSEPEKTKSQPADPKPGKPPKEDKAPPKEDKPPPKEDKSPPKADKPPPKEDKAPPKADKPPPKEDAPGAGAPAPKPKDQAPPPKADGPPAASEPAIAKMVGPGPMMGPMPAYQVGFGYPQYYDGYNGAPFYQGGYGMMMPPPQPVAQPVPVVYYDPYGRPVPCRCDYFSEENPSACSVM